MSEKHKNKNEDNNKNNHEENHIVNFDDEYEKYVYESKWTFELSLCQGHCFLIKKVHVRRQTEMQYTPFMSKLCENTQNSEKFVET